MGKRWGLVVSLCMGSSGIWEGDLNMSNASPRVAWLQQDGNWSQKKPVCQQSLFPVTLGCSCEQKQGDQKTLPSLPHSIWGTAGGHPAAVASSLCFSRYCLAGASLASQCQQSEGSSSLEGERWLLHVFDQCRGCSGGSHFYFEQIS